MPKKSKLLLTVSMALTSISAADTAEFVLVDKNAGIKPAPLILFPDAPPFTREAAADLADYIEKICGTRPEWINGPPRQLPERAIWVGYQPALDSLFPKIDFDFQHPEEIVIAANEKHLVIAGRDRWDPNHLIAHINGKRIEGIQQEYGTVNAIYTFLHDRLDVRWLWPGALGEDIVPQESIRFATFKYRYHPSLRYRAGLFSYSRLAPRGKYGRSQRWTRHQRLQLGSLEMEGGHGFVDWWERFHETHPEYFALQPDGTRSGFPQPKNAKLCQSNPEVPKQWLADVEEALKRNPNQRVFNASPNDGWASGHCVCESCRAWDHPDGEPRSFHWKRTTREMPALSDRHVRFANACARLLEQRYPDRDYYVMMLAYGHSRPAPIREVPAENVIVASVANFLNRDGLIDRGSTWGSTYKEQYIAWSKVAKHTMWRPNVGSPAGWPQGQPDVSLTQTIEDFKLIGEKAMGIFVDMVWEHWATHGPQYYLMAHLLWDPSQDGQAILQNYYQRAFGLAAAELEAYWNLVEETRNIFWASDPPYPDVYDRAFFDRAYALLEQASRKVTDEPERFAARIDFVRIGLDHTRHMIDIRAGMTRYWNGDKSEQANVLAAWEKIEQLCRDHPYAINWGPIRPQTPRMAGLHPDYPLKKRAPVVKRIKSSKSPIPNVKADVFDRVEHHETDNDGVALHYVTLGEGPVILFVHGFPDFWYTWREQMAALSDNYKTVAMDTRAYNKSGKPEGVEHYTMSHLMSDVEAVIKDLDVASVTLVGHDWGGVISWRFAMHYPQLVNKLVICNLTHPKGYGTVRRNATAEQKANTQYITDFQMPGYENQFSPEVLTRISAGKVSDEVRQRYVNAFSQSSVKGMLDYYRAAYSGLTAGSGQSLEMPNLTMPVLQFHGLKDKAVDKDGLRDTWNWIDKDYTLVTIPSSGHWVQREAADIVSNTMRWWLKSRH